MTRVKKLLIGLTINIVWGSCWVNSANAGVITMGTWSAMDPNAAVFWNNPSSDGSQGDVGQLITSWGWPAEQFSDGGASISFAFVQWEFFWEATSITSWLDDRGIQALNDGSANFTNHGFTYNPFTAPQQFALFRYTGDSQTIYFLGTPNMSSDDDHDDSGRPPVPTPEPGTLALMLCGGLAAFRKVRSMRS